MQQQFNVWNARFGNFASRAFKLLAEGGRSGRMLMRVTHGILAARVVFGTGSVNVPEEVTSFMVEHSETDQYHS